MRVVLDLRSVHDGFSGIGRYALNLGASFSSIPELEIHAIASPAGASYVRHWPRVMMHLVEATSAGWENLVLPDLLRSVGADIYHTPLFVLPIAKVCKYVCTIHDVIPLARPDLCPSTFLRFFEENAPPSARRADHVVTVSEFSRRDVVERLGVNAERVSSIHEPISPFFTRRSGSETLKQHDLKRGYILHVGAIDRRKNLGGLLEAVSLLRRQGIARDLAIVGAPSGDGFDLAREIGARELSGCVKVLGRVSDDALIDLYSEAGVFVFPSLYEGFGLPVVEAMACGAPVVASAATSIPEVAGDAALLVDPNKPAAIRDAISRVLTDPGLAAELSAKGKARARDFDLATHGRKLAALYERILSQ